jgi:hypothetical protein
MVRHQANAVLDDLASDTRDFLVPEFLSVVHVKGGDAAREARGELREPVLSSEAGLARSGSLGITYTDKKHTVDDDQILKTTVARTAVSFFFLPPGGLVL